MNFRKHSELEGVHAFLSPSQYHWINYDAEKLKERYLNYTAAQRGTELHDFAKRCIQLGIKLPKVRKTLNLYVNDAIDYKMNPEQVLYFSDNCFGTADSISFRKNFLRIHDYKSGAIPASMHQLEIYEALFCLEYGHDPDKIDSELRIYQSNKISTYHPDPSSIFYIMDKIVAFDKKIDELKMEDRNE